MDDVDLKHLPVIGDLCSWIDDTSVRLQPWVTVAHALPFLGTVLGRKVALGNLRTNLYCLNIAPAGAGKAHASGCLRDVCLQAQCPSLIGSYDVASDSAVEKALLKQPSLVCFWDEISFMFKAMRFANSHYVAKIRPLLMQLYSQADTYVQCKARAMDETTPVLVQPCFSFCGSSTPNEFNESLSIRELYDGWWSRCLFFCTDRIPAKRRLIQPGAHTPVPQSVVDFMARWMADSDDDIIHIPSDGGSALSVPQQKQAVVSKSAEALFAELDGYADSCRMEDSQYWPLWIRAEENAKRIALILASCIDPNAMEVDDVSADLACKVVRKTINDFIHKVFPNVKPERGADVQNTILSIIKEREKSVGYCTWRKVCESTRFVVSRRERQEAFRDLIDSGMIAARQNLPFAEPGYVTTTE